MTDQPKNQLELPAVPELPPGYTTRAMEEADIRVIGELEPILFPAESWSHEALTLEYQATQSVPPYRYYQLIEDPKSTVIGYAGLGIGLPYADVLTIGVLSEHTGRGLGSYLLIWLMHQATDAGAQDLLLEVRADNVRAQELYFRYGFEHIHTRNNYYPGGIDAWVMRRHLKQPQESSATALSQLS